MTDQATQPATNFFMTKPFRCRVGDSTGQRFGSSQCTKAAKLYPGAQMLSDIDIETGEWTYRVVLPRRAYVDIVQSIKRRRHRQ